MSDGLTQRLELTRVRTTLFAITELPEIRGVEFPDGAGAYFHTLSGGGDGWLLIEGAEPWSVAAGDLVLLGRGQAHRICSGRSGEIRTVFDPTTWTPNVVTALPRDNSPDRVALMCAWCIPARCRGVRCSNCFPSSRTSETMRHGSGVTGPASPASVTTRDAFRRTSSGGTLPAGAPLSFRVVAWRVGSRHCCVTNTEGSRSVGSDYSM